MALALAPRIGLAQDTREAALEQQRAEKAKQVEPYNPANSSERCSGTRR